MRTSALALTTAIAIAAVFGSIALADRDEPAKDPVARERKQLGEDPKVTAVEDPEAKLLLQKLDEAGDLAKKEKSPTPLVEAIQPLVERRHEDFVKDLEKLVNHVAPEVRLVAVKALASQEGKKVGPKLLSVVTSKANDDHSEIVAAAIGGLRRQKFDHPAVMKELESLFRKQLDTLVMKECARYFGDLKKLDAFNMMLFWVEAPQPANVNSGSNPPASYWKRMWEIWDGIKEAVWVALYDMTGKTFRTEREWRDWLDTREAKELGLD